MHRPLSRRLVCLWLAAGLVNASHAKPGVQTISWDDLVPANWNPAAQFKEQDLQRLSDSDPRAQELLARMRKILDEAPINSAMQGRLVRLPGYVVPLEEGRDGLREFLLVPYFGACIHTPPPPANQIIHVRLDKPSRLAKSMDAVWLTGELRTERARTDMGQSGYRMQASKLELYSDKR